MNLDPLFREAQIVDSGYLKHIMSQTDETWNSKVLANRHLLLEFGELWPTFSGSKNLPRRISRRYFVAAQPKLAALGALVRSMY